MLIGIQINKKHLKYVTLFIQSTSSPSGPAGSIYSTPEDMGKWMLFHLNEGRGENGLQIIDNNTLKETYREQMATQFFGNMFKPEYPISDSVISYNMGWMSSVYRGTYSFTFFNHLTVVFI